MAPFMKPFQNQTYALMRIMAGALFLWHGTQKLFGFPTPAPDAPPFVIYGAGGIELIGGILVMIGLQTRWAAFLCSGLMASAYWIGFGTPLAIMSFKHEFDRLSAFNLQLGLKLQLAIGLAYGVRTILSPVQNQHGAAA